MVDPRAPAPSGQGVLCDLHPAQTLLNGDIRLNIDMAEMHSFDPPLYRACRDYPREVRACSRPGSPGAGFAPRNPWSC
jgi:hypothetical protein